MPKMRPVFIIFLLAVLLFPCLLRTEVSCAQEQKEGLDNQESVTRPTVEYVADKLRDPFEGVITEETVMEDSHAQAVVTPQPEPPSLVVQGIIWGGDFNQAIINHKVVKAGDTIEGVRIVSVDKEGVAALFEGRQYTIPSPAATKPPKKDGDIKEDKNEKTL